MFMMRLPRKDVNTNMCLRNSPSRVQEWLTENADKKEVRVWKVVKQVGRGSSVKLAPYFRHTVYGPRGTLMGGVTYETGINKSDAERRGPSFEDEDIHKGIHVFWTKEMAEEWLRLRFADSRSVIMEMWVTPIEILGASTTEGVFKSVRIIKEEYGRAVTEIRRTNYREAVQYDGWTPWVLPKPPEISHPQKDFAAEMRFSDATRLAAVASALSPKIPVVF